MAWTDALGIHAGNAWENIISYSLLASTALDLAASAAGKIDVEAARFLRLAQGMVRKRLDLLIAQAFYGPQKQVAGREIGMQVSSRSFSAFGQLYPLCSQDTAALAKPTAATSSDLEKVGAHLKPAFDGALLDNLDTVVRAEVAFHQAAHEDVLATVGEAQAEMLGQLQNGAASIADLIMHAAALLREKLAAQQDVYLCTGCGSLYYELPEKCSTCESPASLIIAYPFKPGPLIVAIENRLFSATGAP